MGNKTKNSIFNDTLEQKGNRKTGYLSEEDEAYIKKEAKDSVDELVKMFGSKKPVLGGAAKIKK